MALEKITYIEGLDSSYEDIELMNDTPLGVTKVKFFLKSEDMPFLSEKEGRVIRKNFVWIEKIINLGNLIIQRRCKDIVEYDENTGKWAVRKLASGMESDIKLYNNEWNAFARGASSDIIGTPLEFLFKNDPSKVEGYKAKHVHTIEQLSQFSDVHIQDVGFGTRQDVEMAKYYMKKIQEQAPAIELNNKFEEKDSEIRYLKNQLNETIAMMNRVMSEKGFDDKEAPKVRKPRGPNTKIKIEKDEE